MLYFTQRDKPLSQAETRITVDPNRGWVYERPEARARRIASELARAATLGSRDDEELADYLISRIVDEPRNRGVVAIAENMARRLTTDYVINAPYVSSGGQSDRSSTDTVKMPHINNASPYSSDADTQMFRRVS